MSAPKPGRSLVTRRAIRDLVRTATLSTYGVTGFSGGGPLYDLLFSSTIPATVTDCLPWPGPASCELPSDGCE